MKTCIEKSSGSRRVRGLEMKLTLILLLLTLAGAAQAQFSYLVTNGAVTITGYTGPGGDVAIPDTISGHPVTVIGDFAFRDCSRLTSVTIPSGVTSIGVSAFNGCASLTNVTMPNSVTSIGINAFAFCTSLANVIIPNSVTSIGVGAFSWCSSLTNITIPNSVTSIERWAFSGCTGLINVTIPDSVTWIGVLAFVGCTSLTNIAIGNSVTSIGDDAFWECTRLMAITVDPLNPVYSSVDGVLLNKSQTTLIQCPGGKSGSYTVPDSVTSIRGGSWPPPNEWGGGTGAFGGCTGLTNITIPSSVTDLGVVAFGGCSNLTAITVDPPNSYYSSVDGVVFNKNQTTLIQAPEGKTGSYTIPSSVTSIGEWAFAYCSSLKGIYFQGNAPSVGDSVFLGSNSTVYYLPGTTGWGPEFGGRPTTFWVLPAPLILSQGPDFGLRTNGFGFIISWAMNSAVVVEACTNVASGFWAPVTTNALTGGWSDFTDTRWRDYAARFYRVRSQ